MIAMREVRAIYHQGVWAVAAAFRQLYELIEVADEGVHRRVAAANGAHLRKIEQLTARIRRLEEELAGKVRQVYNSTSRSGNSTSNSRNLGDRRGRPRSGTSRT